MASPDRQYTVAILGATGLVGSHLISILEERNFPVKTLVPLASGKSAGQSVRFKNENVTVVEATPDAFDGVDIVLASAGASVSKLLIPEAVKRGAVVVDNTSFFRMHPDVPLVVAGVNNDDLKKHRGIVANPNCSTMQLMPVLKTLNQLSPMKRVIVSTYQSVSGAGKKGIDELLESTAEFLRRTEDPQAPMSDPKVFQRPIAFNLIPHIDVFMDGDEEGYTKEETKIIHETRKILHRPDLLISATAVRVPVMVGHSEAVTIDFEIPVSPKQATEALAKNPDIIVRSENTDYPTPVEATGKDPVYVGRIRRDLSNPKTGLCLWVVADNLRIGAALNTVRLAEELAKMDLVRVPEGKTVAAV